MAAQQKTASTNKAIIMGITITVVASLIISTIGGFFTYRDSVMTNQVLLTEIKNSQVNILEELKDLKTIVGELNANYQVLKQDQVQDERDIDRLYDRVDSLSEIAHQKAAK